MFSAHSKQEVKLGKTRTCGVFFRFDRQRTEYLQSSSCRRSCENCKKEFVPFSINIEFNKPATERGWVVFEKDNPSGLPENADSLKIPVAFGTTKETSSVKVYFSSNALNPGAEDCSKVFPIERTIPKTEAIARAALEELLKGPTNKEAEREYFFQ